MSVSNPSAATASQPKSSDLDIEQLVGLLGSLMPLLLQFQEMQSAFGAPASWGQHQRQLTPQDVSDITRQLIGVIPQVIGNLQDRVHPYCARHISRSLFCGLLAAQGLSESDAANRQRFPPKRGWTAPLILQGERTLFRGRADSYCGGAYRVYAKDARRGQQKQMY